MFGLRYLRPLRNLLRVFAAERTPHQLALGAAIGLLIGVLPKGNLLAVTATFLLFALRVNMGIGLTTAFLISLLGPSLDQLTHGIGVRVLQTPLVYGLLSHGYQLPLVPWTSLNNSIVVGSLLLGLTLVYPTYHLSRQLAERVLPLLRRLRRRPSVATTPLHME